MASAAAELPCIAVGAAESGATSVVHCNMPVFLSSMFLPVGSHFANFMYRRDRGMSLSAEEATDKEESTAETDDIDTGDTEGMDASEWKHQDHYKLLGLGKERWTATDDDIKKAYKKVVLIHHPDKKMTAKTTEEERAQNDAYFTCIKKAFEVLSNPAKRRLFDSVDEYSDIDDTVPNVTKDPKAFYSVFGKAFEKNSRWLIQQPAPALGDDSTPEEQVRAFYSHWYNSGSWREFGYFVEHDPESAEDRDHKRQIIKENKAALKKKKTEENARMIKLIDNAYSSDPRIKRFNEAKKQQKLEAARAKAAEKEAIEKAARDKIRAEEEARKAAEQAAKEASKADSEAGRKARRALAKAVKRHNVVAEGVCTEEHLETIRTTESNETMEKIARLPDKAAFVEALKALIDAYEQKRIKEEKKIKPWTEEEQKLLEAALRDIPRTADDRFELIAARLPGRTKKQCMLRVKECAEAVAKAKAAPATAPAEWTHEEMTVVVRAASHVYPPGTQGDRWQLIADYLHVHAHTEWTRPAKEVVAKVNALKDIKATHTEKKAAAAEKDFDPNALRLKSRDKSVPTESVPSQRFEHPAVIAKEALADGEEDNEDAKFFD